MKLNDTKHNLCVFYSSLKDLCVALVNLEEKKLTQQNSKTSTTATLRTSFQFERYFIL